ncbi:MAG: YfcE family phosphodiesterase [Thermodesulfobacteriota bacterium]|nr:YfcE family phosphodiesterase [Thermodesulfobacteriota bacterium]
MKILLISDIHANFPALQAVAKYAPPADFDLVCNCGDTTVYAPFPNETIKWLKRHNAISILGNTDRKILQLAKGKQLKKPSKPDKRIMYSWTFDVLKKSSLSYLKSLHKKNIFQVNGVKIGLFHGSPEDPDEFLFHTTAEDRFRALAKKAKQDIICVGHSHTPFHKQFEGVHFVNPGSVGRMFDGNPATSFAILEIKKRKITVSHHRVPWKIKKMKKVLRDNQLPEIYINMYEQGLKLN